MKPAKTMFWGLICGAIAGMSLWMAIFIQTLEVR